MLLINELKKELTALNNVISVLININYQDKYHLHIYIYCNNMDDGNILDNTNVLIEKYENLLRNNTEHKWCLDLQLVYC